MLQALQSLISGIYDVPLSHQVTDFLITDCERLPDTFRTNGTDEQVLVREDESTLWMTLYLERGVLERLGSANPLEALNSRNVADYWTVLEGVSHFVCVAWHAAHDQSVTMLELELQGEIDKYVTSFWLLNQQHPNRFPAELHNILFERTRVDALLAG